MSFSDKGRDIWFDYLDHDGNSAVQFKGNSDRHTISEGMLRQPISARFVKIKPKTWEKKIAMRVDIIGCKASERVDCTDDGNTFATHGDLFSIDCPSECDKAEFKIVAFLAKIFDKRNRFLSKISIFVEKYDF